MLLCVVDADCEAAVSMCEELLPPTPWTVDTQHGRHYYYLTDEISTQRIMGGLDRKCGPNVYVVAPGTSGYVPSADWGQGWPPALTMRQWLVLERAWLDQRREPETVPEDRHGSRSSRRRRSTGDHRGSANWRSQNQRCEIHAVCEGRRNSYVRRVLMSRLFSWFRKDG